MTLTVAKGIGSQRLAARPDDCAVVGSNLSAIDHAHINASQITAPKLSHRHEPEGIGPKARSKLLAPVVSLWSDFKERVANLNSAAHWQVVYREIELQN